MTRVFTDGAEFDDLLFWDASSNITAGAGYARSGGYGYRVNGAGGLRNINDLDEFYLRIPYQLTLNHTDVIVAFRHGATTIADVYYTSTTQKISARVNAVIVATSSAAYPAGNWFLMEVHFKMADAGDFEIKMNGVLDVDYSGDTKPGTDAHIDNIYFAITSNYPMYVDDLALNDINGAVDNSWCGDGHVELLVANDNGDVNNWVGQDGDSVNNYLNVDDIPPDSDTTYNKASTDVQDMYNVSDYTPTGKIVTRVYAECRAKDNAALSGAVWLGYKTGGNVYLSSAVRTLSSSYGRIVGDEALVNPADAGIWEEADLDAIQFVIEASSSSSSSSSTSSSSTTSSSSSSSIP